MKNASQIINIIQNKPQFSQLSRVKCIKKIQSLLMPPVQKMINFSYFKGNTLFFVFNHPAGKQEFDNNIQNIKNALNFHHPVECDNIIIEDIKAFVTHSPNKKVDKKNITFATYPERAKGNFKIQIKDEKLYSLVQSIKEIIKKSNDIN